MNHDIQFLESPNMARDLRLNNLNYACSIHHKSKSKVTQRTEKSSSVNSLNSFDCSSSVSNVMEGPCCPLILMTHFLLPPFSLTSFNLSATSFLQSSLSSFDKSRLRITLLKLSLSFNLLLLSRTMFLVSKLSNFINNGLGFEDSSTFLPILNIRVCHWSLDFLNIYNQGFHFIFK